MKEAEPALLEAQKAAQNLKKAQITEMKNFIIPIQSIMNVGCAICCLFQRKENWDEGKKIMSEMDFQKNLMTMDPMGLP